MVAVAKQVGERRYRESVGRFYEEFAVGDIYEHRPGRTITETENTWFTLLTMNKHPLHFDAEYAKHSEFGRCLVASPFTLSLIVGMSVSDVLRVDTGSLYPALHRLEKQRWISATWKLSANKQRTRVYRLTAAGRRQLASERTRWQTLVDAMSGILARPQEGDA